MQTTLTDAASSAASTLREKADALDTMPGGRKVARAAYAAADAVQSTANYLGERDWNEVLGDARAFARRNPGATLLTAAAIGFLLARSLSRR